MNGLRNETKQKKKNNSIFTTETFGVVLSLFSALCLICVISRDLVFSAPGKYVCDFLVGIFGYSAIAVCLSSFVLGILLLLGKKIDISIKHKLVITLIAIITALLLHTVSMRDYSSLSYGEYLTKAYELGNGGLKGSSCGGIVLSLIAYILPSILTNIGTYIVLAILLAITLFFFGKDIYENSLQTASVSNLKSSFVRKNANEIPNPENLPERDYPVEGIDFSASAKDSSQRLFVNNPETFELKSKREIRRDNDANIKLDHTNNGLTVVKANTASGMSYEMEQKINYIKTPAKINLEYIVKPTENEGVNVSKPIKDFYSNFGNQNYVAEETVKDDNAEKENKVEEIPLHLHDESVKTDSAESHAIEFSNKYAFIPEENTENGNMEKTEPQDVSVTPIETDESNYDEEFDKQKLEAIMEETEYLNSSSNNDSFSPFGKTEEVDKDLNISNVQKPSEAIFGNLVEPKENVVNNDFVSPIKNQNLAPSLNTDFVKKEEVKEIKEEKPKKETIQSNKFRFHLVNLEIRAFL